MIKLIFLIILSFNVLAKDTVKIEYPKNYQTNLKMKNSYLRIQLTHKEKQRKNLVKKVKKLAAQEGINLTIYPDHQFPKIKTNLGINGDKVKVESFLKKLKAVVDKV